MRTNNKFSFSRLMKGGFLFILFCNVIVFGIFLGNIVRTNIGTGGVKDDALGRDSAEISWVGVGQEESGENKRSSIDTKQQHDKGAMVGVNADTLGEDGEVVEVARLEREVTQPPEPDVMVKMDLALSRYPTAVCNDGSPGAYYITRAAVHKGKAAAQNVWLVFLQGGGWCWDTISCAGRWEYERGLMSSAGYLPTRNATGIFSPDPDLSPFASANKVYIPYCSSDAFVGNMAKNKSLSLSWHFRGQDLIRATIDSLKSRAENPLSKGHVVYFGGCSAGGRGALFNYEYLPQMLPKGVRVYGLFDSVMWVDMPSLVGGVTFRAQTEGVLKMANASARLGDACDKMYPNEQVNPNFTCFTSTKVQKLTLTRLLLPGQVEVSVW